MAFQKVKPEKPINELTLLDVKCTTTRCDDNFHCFKTSQKMIKKFGTKGVCRDCGENHVDWNRVHKNDIADSGYTFDKMKIELLRNICWSMPLDEETVQLAKHRGKKNLREKAKKTLIQKVSKDKNFREGYQTPKTGNEIIHFAQHATGTCCRKCMEYWHNIPMGTNLTEPQLDYATELIMLYIEQRIDNLPEDGED